MIVREWGVEVAGVGSLVLEGGGEGWDYQTTS